jgi:hypothetical protein
MSTKQEQILKIDPPIELSFTGKLSMLLVYSYLLNIRLSKSIINQNLNI